MDKVLKYSDSGVIYHHQNPFESNCLPPSAADPATPVKTKLQNSQSQITTWDL
jgi:hypothetical protein